MKKKLDCTERTFFGAILKYDRKLIDLTYIQSAFVYRMQNRLRWCICHPCEKCQKLIFLIMINSMEF